MKHFNLDNKPCRALPFDKELQGPKRLELAKNNIFVKLTDKTKDTTSEDLEKYFSEHHGPVKSAKLSINPDSTSRGYGFVCFEKQ